MNGHPIRLAVAGDLERRRLTVLVRPILLIPLLIWWYVWGIVAALATVVSWIATLVRGETPRSLHDFLAAYVRFQVHVYAYGSFTAEPYPGFFGEPGYPVDLEVDPPARQNRWVTAFRWILALPAAIVAGILTYLLYAMALFGWIVCLVTGRLPAGMRGLNAFVIRFVSQTYAYSSFLTARYPTFGTEA